MLFCAPPPFAQSACMCDCCLRGGSGHNGCRRFFRSLSSWHGLVHGWLGFSRRIPAAVILLFCRTAHGTWIQARACQGAFWICGALILAVLACPYIGVGDGPSVFNGIYDTFLHSGGISCHSIYGRVWATTDIMSTRICGFSRPVVISRLYHTLSGHVSVLCLGVEQWSFLRTRVWPVCVALLVLITAHGVGRAAFL